MINHNWLIGRLKGALREWTNVINLESTTTPSLVFLRGASSLASADLDAVINENFHKFHTYLITSSVISVMQRQNGWKLLWALYLHSVSLFITCVIRFPLSSPPLWASAVTVPMWVCCHLLPKSCGIWGCKVDIRGMAPRTLYDRLNSQHMLFSFSVPALFSHAPFIDLC